MAEKRMFSKSIVNSDAFLDMPLSTQALYFHLGMEADDEGFVGNPKRIQRIIGASDDDMKILLAKRYLLSFESGIVVVKHWYINNYIQSDRKKETTYIEEKNTLRIDDKKAYTEKANRHLDTNCIQNGYNLDTQIRLEEIRLDKNSVDNNAHARENDPEQNNGYFSDIDFLPSQPTIKDIQDYITLKGYDVDAERFYNYYSAKGWMLGNNPIQNWQYLVDEWGRKNMIRERYVQPNGTQQRENNGYKFGSVEISDDDI